MCLRRMEQVERGSTIYTLQLTESVSKTGFVANAGGTKLKMEAGYGYEWSGGKSRKVERGNAYKLTVPAERTYEAKGMVKEAIMEVPYAMKIDIGGSEYTNRGIWNGVAVSDSLFEVRDITHGANALVETPKLARLGRPITSTASGNIGVVFFAFVAFSTFSLVLYKRRRNDDPIMRPFLLGV